MSSDGPQTSSSRPLALRMRPDLEATRARYQGVRYWLVKDPVGLRYFRFQDEEFSLLKLLDGHRSLDEIREEFEASYRPQQISAEELQRFVGHLHAGGLVISNNPGQGIQLLKRTQTMQKKKRVALFANILFVKLPGFDPERILQWLYPKVSWFFSPFGFLGAILLMLAALTLVIVNYDTFSSQPEFQKFSNFFNIHNVLLLWISLGVAKIIHEFGHGLACTHFGGECHEMGVLFLVLTPCLYCNVSDSWMMPNKWHRIFISSAGIYVEVVLASLATFIWWNTSQGVLHNLAFSTMFICSVSTVLFNANPLLRYDGYYIMMDLLEIPNLRTKSSRLLQQVFMKWALGIEPPDDPFMPKVRRWAFVTYAIASYLYRWVVTFSILFFLYQFLGTLPEPWNKLRGLSWLMAILALTTLFVMPMVRMVKYLWSSRGRNEVNKVRAAISACLLAGLLAVLFWVPFPLRIECAMTIEPQEDASYIFVRTPGSIENVNVSAGEAVSRGQVLATLVNMDIDQEMERLQGRYDQQLEEVNIARVLQQTAELEAAGELLASIEDELQENRQYKNNLTLRSPHNGVVIPPVYMPRSDPILEKQKLSSWYGSPLDPENQDAFLDTGQVLCTVGRVDQWDALLVIDQADYEYIRKDQKVWLKLDELPEETLEGTVAKKARVDMEVAPQVLSNRLGGRIPTEPGPGGMERTIGVFYQVRVELPDPNERFRPGFRGKAKIDAGTRTLASRLWRWLNDTFHFRL